MFSFFVVVGLILLTWLCWELSVFVCWLPESFSILPLEFVGCVDFVTMLGFLMLSVCSCLALIYCFHYYYNSSEAYILFLLMTAFVAIMFILMLSSSMMFTLVMWEYLGFLSFLLILFYSNSSSLRASLITLFSSRFGDVGLFIVLVYILSSGLWLGWIFFFSFFLVVISKSAGFPFISWLLEAMRAPTPVSSLVHSSTLVAAGVWFVIRYNIYVSSELCFFLFIVSLLTVVITGICSLFFFDLKKIVALSTCNNVAWCLLFFVCGDLFLVMCQLLVHGVCKCALFILVGDVMSTSGGSQSSISIYMPRYGGFYSVGLLVFLVFCLCGFPFIGIFFTKHFFYMFLVGGVYNVVLLLLVLFGFMLSYAYSFRLALLICSLVRGLATGYLVSFLFVSFFVLLGTLCSWFFLGVFEEVAHVCLLHSVLYMVVMVLGSGFGYYFCSGDYLGCFWNSLLWGSEGLVGWFYFVSDYFSGLCVVALHRVEIYFLRALGSFSSWVGDVKFYVFSLNFIVFGVVLYFLYFVLL